MVLLGAVLLILGLVLPSSILLIVGVILLVVGLLGNGFGHFGRPVAGRRYWY